jgi:surface carbohydrate biosynthesis protein
MNGVVILVDSKTRDLDVAALTAHHLSGLGIECHLEPLEAFRAVLAAYHPAMVIINHLTASHLAAWSNRLAEMGVLTAVLPNEGVIYDPDNLRFLAGRFHRDAHIDYFFCWNEAHRQALVDQGIHKNSKLKVIGGPRFDFYFEPWSKAVTNLSVNTGRRPKVLFCTNFTTAQYWELPRSEADRLFAPWADRIPLYKNYWPAIETHWRSRQQALVYLEALIAENKFDIILRPHPSEDHTFYGRWLGTLSVSDRAQVEFDSTSSISSLILGCDIEISCETCTTAMESWIAGKPTIELIFERHPLWYREIQAKANIECDDPAKLPALVSEQLDRPLRQKLIELRREHLRQWCDSPDGKSCFRMAQIIADAVRTKKPANWSKLTVNDYRRATKLRGTQRLGVAYHFDPLLFLKQRLLPKRYAVKEYTYRKSIKPQDVAAARKRISILSAGHLPGACSDAAGEKMCI